MSIEWEKYGNTISDRIGELRNISEIISELEEIEGNFSTDAMSDYALFLQGKAKAEMLNEIIQYLRKV